MIGAAYYTLQVVDRRELLERARERRHRQRLLHGGHVVPGRARPSTTGPRERHLAATASPGRPACSPARSPRRCRRRRPARSIPPKLDGIPIWSWSAVPGAVAYDVHVDYPNGTTKDVNGIQAPRPRGRSSTVPASGTGRCAPSSRRAAAAPCRGRTRATQTFTRTFGEPLGRRVVATKTRLIFSWEPKQGAKTYHLQVSANPDFSSTIDDVTQDGARFAPTLTSDGYVNGGRLFWHVAAVDAEGNQGDWSPTSKVTLAKGLKIGGDADPGQGQVADRHDHGHERQGRARSRT